MTPDPASSGSPPPPNPAPARSSAISRDPANIAAAGLLTAAAAFGQWAELTARYFEHIRPAFGAKSGAGGAAPDPASILMDSYVAYVRDVAELPRFALLRFYNELARLKGDSATG